uniref:Uncharacterized protein n=1 Tax=viral metagenome TaxID=1070528 RepID=A0A6C0JF32_9ZZZZ
MEDKIIRKYPELRYEEDRYNKEDFERYEEITKRIDNYEKWKIGINYKTNRKIKIGGKTHEQFGYENFYIKRGTSYSYSYVLFTKLDNINIELYIQETEKLKKEIQEYNSQIYEIISKINKLDKWSDFIEFEGKKYGIVGKVLNNIHRENDCNGIMEFYKNEEYECKGCRDGMAFNGSYSCGCSNKEIYKCNKCDYIE